MVTIPIWHWGGNYNKYRAAKVDETVMELQLADAKTMVDLQVQQASFKTTEAYKTYKTAESNLTSANETCVVPTLPSAKEWPLPTMCLKHRPHGSKPIQKKSTQ